MDAIDLYCERTAPGLWAEPFNVTSNIAFVMAAWAVWRLSRDPQVPGSLARLFGALALAIAIGSTLFHMFATTWARPLDEGPIVLFQLVFLWQYGRRVLGARTSTVVLLMAGLVLTSGIARAFTGAVNGSLAYFPAGLLTMVLGIDHARANRRGRWTLLAGSALFTVAVCLRSIDNAVCSAWPVGTHAFWHVLAAAVLYLFARGLLSNSDVR